MSDKKESNITSTASIIKLVFYSLILILSLFLAFTCNRGFDLIHFLAALCCPICYLPYGLYCVFASPGF